MGKSYRNADGRGGSYVSEQLDSNQAFKRHKLAIKQQRRAAKAATTQQSGTATK